MLVDTLYQPIFVSTGQEALDLFKHDPRRFPLILMDVSMPVMDGFQATEAIRAYEKLGFESSMIEMKVKLKPSEETQSA